MPRETITERIGENGNRIIEHHTEGIKLYPGLLGKKCDYCECYFANNYDEYLHLEAKGRRPHGNGIDVDSNSLDGLAWKKSDFDDGEYVAVGKNIALAQACKMKGKLKIGIYDYSVSKNGKWLKRRRSKS